MSQGNASGSNYSFYDFTDGFSDGASFTGDVFESIAKGQTNLAQAYDQIADALHKDISRMSNLAYDFSGRAALAGDAAAASAYQKIADGYQAMADTRLTATSEAFVKSIASNADAMTSAGIGKLGGAAGNLVDFGAGMHAFATAGDSTKLGEAIAGIAAGAFGAWAAAAALTFFGAPALIGTLGVGIAGAIVGLIAGSLAGDYFGGAIGDAVNDAFNAAKGWIPLVDPLVLDLDGDGIETVGANGTVLFDHDGDGTKHATGWVKSDDGLLVLDRNANGLIDNGSELFGVETVKPNGSKATDGFDALKTLDANGDGVFNNADSQYSNVRLWRDLNQNGISEANELTTLAANGIASINLTAAESNTNLTGGNRVLFTGSYARTDGTTKQAGSLDLATGHFWREFGDTLPLTEQARVLPNLRGSGAVRDLRKAVNDGVWEKVA